MAGRVKRKAGLAAAATLAARAAAERHDPALPDDARRLAFLEAVRRAAADG